MLKQWLHGQKNCNHSSRFRMHLYDRSSSYHNPFAEKFIVCRVNPLFAEEGFHHRNPGLPTFVTNDGESQVHVQKWCSIVCPRHLTTCCICKPVLTYCDHCVGLLSINQHGCCDNRGTSKQSAASSYRRFHSRKAIMEKKLRDPLSLKTTASSNKRADVNSVYNVTKSQERRPFSSTLRRSQQNHVYEQIGGQKEETLSGHEFQKAKGLHVYMNSEFISGIGVATNAKPKQTDYDDLAGDLGQNGVNVVNQQGVDVRWVSPTAGHSEHCDRAVVALLPNNEQGKGSHAHYDVALKSADKGHSGLNSFNRKLSQNNSVIDIEDGLSFRRDLSGDAVETDSLESLKIDEGMFSPVANEHMPRTEDHMKINHVTSSIKRTLENLPSGIFASADLADAEMAYEAIKDLYEKLSNNKHRRAVTQAVNGSQRSSISCKGCSRAAYETLSRHKRLSYAELVDEETKRNAVPPTTYYDNILLRSANSSVCCKQLVSHESAEHLPGIKRTSHSKQQQQQQQKLDDKMTSREMLSEIVNETPVRSEHIVDRIEVYPEIQTTPATPNNKQPASRKKKGKAPTTVMGKLRKRFDTKPYRDACKIIATTILGLIAFGIITALSLSVK